jgi:hypothetical protein
MWEEQEGKCSYTGWDMTTITKDSKLISIERKESNIGYIKSNCELVCWSVNRAKNTMKREEFIELCRTILHYETKNNQY